MGSPAARKGTARPLSLGRHGLVPFAPRLPQAVSEAKRQRDVFLLYSLAFRDLLHIDSPGTTPEDYAIPSDHVPQDPKDSALTAFAQLACMRVGAKRALISLIDDQRQHILAEHLLLLVYVEAKSSMRLSASPVRPYRDA